MSKHLAPSTTQQAYPRRATARTVVQNVLGWVVGAGVVIPAAVLIVQEQLADFLPQQLVGTLVAVGAVSAAVAGAAARFMAIPRVDAWLKGVHLSSSPRVEKP